MKKLNRVLYSELIIGIYEGEYSDSGWFNEWIVSFWKIVQESEGRTFCVLEEHCKSGLFTMQFYLIDNLCKYFGGSEE